MARMHPALKLIFLLPLLWKHKWISLVVLIAGGIWYSVELQIRDHLVYAGEPEASEWALNTWTHSLRSDGFLLGYSEWRANPLWVSYRLTPIGEHKRMKRPGRFSADERTLRRIRHEDYSRSGYDRGHMAPNYAISQLYGRSAQIDTFEMSNIVPQKPNLNRKLWQRMEEIEADYFTQWFGEVWVLTGPVFDAQISTLDSGVEIPDAFYKIYLIPPSNASEKPKMLAFLTPQNVKGNEPLERFVTSVDNIERRTGLDFFPDMDPALERQLESRRSTLGWRLNEVSQLPGRYAK